MTKGNWEKDGYMTLEASFIMPITVILITALMYLSFYLYTIAFLNQAAYIAAFRASLCDEGECRKPRRRQPGSWINCLRKAYFRLKAWKNKSMFLQFPVGVSLQANLALPAPGLQLISQKEWDITAEKKVLIRDAAAFIRAARRIGDFIGIICNNSGQQIYSRRCAVLN